MKEVATECRRVLKPKGSAVFILQPNYEAVGRMRLWLWEFVLSVSVRSVLAGEGDEHLVVAVRAAHAVGMTAWAPV
jgi:hypothetical protein